MTLTAILVIVGSILAVWLLIVGVLWIVGRKYNKKEVK
jgi:hypothetical protein